MNRRALLACVAGALSMRYVHAAPTAGRVYRLGALFIGSKCVSQAELLKEWGVTDVLRERGFVEGRNLVVESRCLGTDYQQAPRMAAELVRSRPDVLITVGSTTTKALQDVTRTIPIVTLVGDPIASGFAKSYARPGGNITGLAGSHPEGPAKQTDLLRRVVPRLERLTLIGDSEYQTARDLFRPYEAAAKVAGLATEVKLIGPSGFEDVFKAMKRGGTQAAFILFPRIDQTQLAEAARLAIRHGVPTMFFVRGFVEQGGLMSFNMYPSLGTARVVHLIADIFEGANPAVIPWEIPDRVHFAINLGTAKLLGLTVPADLLLQADQVIE